MPTPPSTSSGQAVAPPAPPEPMYPAVENFIETASAEQVSALFASIKEGLGGLKGPKADQSKKVTVALERTEELLNHLLEVREKLTSDKKAAKGRK